MQGLQTYQSKTGLALFVPFAKVDEEKRMVWGYASTEAVDSEGEIVTKEALIGALPGYMKFANIREMHQLSAVGVAKEAEVDEKGLYLGSKIIDDAAWVKVKEGVYKGYSIGGRATARDPTNRLKITGLDLIEISLVDRPANPEALFDVWRAEGAAQKKGRTMAKPKTHQPKQNWDCGMPLHTHSTQNDAVKCMQSQDERFGNSASGQAARDMIRAMSTQVGDFDAETLMKMSVHLEKFDPNAIKIDVEGAGELPDDGPRVTLPPDPVKAAMKSATPVKLAELESGGTGDPKLDRNLAEAARYIAAAKDPSVVDKSHEAIEASNEILRGKKPKPKDDDGDDDKEPDADDAEGADKAATTDDDDLGKKNKDPDKPYGDVKYADPGYQSDGKARYPIDTEEHIRAAWNYINKDKNAAKYSSSQVSSIKRRIVSAWKSEIDPDGPPSAKVAGTKEKSMSSIFHKAFGMPDTQSSVKKGIETVIAMLAAMKSLNDIRNCLDKEKAAEGDDSAATSRCDVILADLGELVKDVCGEEIGELLDSHMDVDFRWGRGPYDIMWAAKALKPAMLTMSKKEFAEMWDEFLGDDTAKGNFLALSEFSDNITKSNGSLSIEEWTKPGEGTAYGPHSSDANDSWGSHGESAQKVHDLAVKMGAKCDTEKTHSDIPGATGGGSPKDPPKDIKDGTGGHSNIDGATGDGDPKDPPKELANKKKKPNEGKRDDDAKDPPLPGNGSEKLLAVLMERTLETNERLLDIVERGMQQNRAADRDPPRPSRNGGPRLMAVGKGDDVSPVPGDGDTDDATDTHKTDAEKAEDVLKNQLSRPHFIAR